MVEIVLCLTTAHVQKTSGKESPVRKVVNILCIWPGHYSHILQAICNSMCQNGGNCTSPNNCTCPEGEWKGDTCEIGKKYIIHVPA